MDTVLKIRAASLSPELVEDLKKQIGQSTELEIHIHNAPDSTEWLTETRFWELIALIGWGKAEDEDAMLEPLIVALAELPAACIFQFEDILSEKLWRLDTAAHARASLEEGQTEEEISVDYFLYDRCGVVACGKEKYEEVLRRPAAWPVGLSFEGLLNVSHEAFERKTGGEFFHVPAFNYETYSNEKGWE